MHFGDDSDVVGFFFKLQFSFREVCNKEDSHKREINSHPVLPSNTFSFRFRVLAERLVFPRVNIYCLPTFFYCEPLKEI